MNLNKTEKLYLTIISSIVVVALIVVLLPIRYVLPAIIVSPIPPLP